MKETFSDFRNSFARESGIDRESKAPEKEEEDDLPNQNLRSDLTDDK